MDIRDATAADLPQILAIHNDVVTNTTAIYDQTTSTLEERRAWFDGRTKQGMPVLVAVDANGEVLGYASFGEWRTRWGYRHTVEHSVHVRSDQRGRGIGSSLVKALFPRATKMGMHVMIAGIDGKATASMRMHEKLGFEKVAVFPEVGRLHDGWHDLVCMQKML